MIFKFELSEQMLAVISQALGNAPYSQAAPVVAEMQRQVDEQKRAETMKVAVGRN